MHTKIRQKKAVSPVITTMVLIMLALVLASIIFIWAKGFIGEQVSKFDKPIEDSCANVVMDGIVLVADNKITVSNNGNVPLYKVGIRVTSPSGNSEIEYVLLNLFQGSSLTIDSSKTLEDNKVDLIPVLLGRTSKGSSGEFICLDNAVNVM